MLAVAVESLERDSDDGTRGSATGPTATIEQEWDRNSWSVVSTPVNPSPAKDLFAVTCASADDWWQWAITPAAPTRSVARGPALTGPRVASSLSSRTTRLGRQRLRPRRASRSVSLGQANSDVASVTGDAANGSPTGTVTFFGVSVGTIDSSANGATYRIDGAKNATSALSFTGTSVEWITATGPSYGEAGVSIDGVSMGRSISMPLRCTGRWRSHIPAWQRERTQS